ncbi:hypothetical protein IWW50_002702 [Coemansia erecta]|nr:hypothetical protein GGF43_001967 [Coemansia sp. RSA 2618]KAJ2825768.1 hypothetical protein IWW50_002702 [Coemansia erecta]
MATAYYVGVKNQFGNMLRHVVNSLLDKPWHIKEIRARMHDQTEAEIQNACTREVWAPDHQLKEALVFLHEDKVMTTDRTVTACVYLQQFFDAYNAEFELHEDGLYTDVKANPARHYYTYYVLARILESHDLPTFQAFPLQGSWIPGYITVDAMVAKRTILGIKGSNPKTGEFYSVWQNIVNLRHKAFRSRNGYHFWGTIFTDGVTACIVKSKSHNRRGRQKVNQAKTKLPPILKCKWSIKHDDDSIPYISAIPPEDLCKLPGPFVYIDPGRCQRIFAMSQNSTPEAPQVLRNTQSEHDHHTRVQRYAEIREAVKTDDVRSAEKLLSTVSSRALRPTTFDTFLRISGVVWSILADHYADTETIAPSDVGQHKRFLCHRQRQEQWIHHTEHKQQQQQHILQIQECQFTNHARQHQLHDEEQELWPLKHEQGHQYRARKQMMESELDKQKIQHANERKQLERQHMHQLEQQHYMNLKHLKASQMQERMELQKPHQEALDQLYAQQQAKLKQEQQKQKVDHETNVTEWQSKQDPVTE